LYFIAITLLRSLAQRGSAERQFAQRYGLVALAASYRAWRDLYRQRERAFAQAMADRQGMAARHRYIRRLAVAADAGLRRRKPGQRSTDQERPSLAAQTVGAAADPERHSV